MTTIDISNRIAVIGMACRFPGAENIDRFWENLKNGVESITEFTNEDLEKSGIDPSVYNRPDYVKKGFVMDDEDLFDASFFGYSPREAETMDPQHRLFLETAWSALEDGGYPPGEYERPVGVFAGSKISTYLLNLMNGRATSEAISDYQALIGNDKDYLATRVSYKLNLKGPSVSVQSACSTSLVAVHFACENLLSGACDMALAGGAAILVPQRAGYLYREGMMLSPDGHCRAFDHRAKGMAPGNGVGIVLLKRLEDAIKDNDFIYAVVLGTAVNNDGSRKTGYTTPGVEGQAKVIREAIAVAGVDCESISYLETHGTGTELGDPIEIEAANSVFKAQTGKTGFCAIGSVKTNIGHLDTAAGVAGFIKTVLSLKNGLLPPSLNYERPNPKIDFRNSPFYVNAKPSEWKTNGYPRRAGVSSFGFGGTNAHVVLEQAPETIPNIALAEAPLYFMTVSAKDESALKRQVENYARFLRENPEVSLGDVCFTANAGRTRFSRRFAVIARSRQDLLDQLDAFENGVEGVDDSDLFVSPSVHGRDLSPQALSRNFEDLKDAYLAGKKVDWEAVYQNAPYRRIPMPAYPFSRKRYWVETPLPSARGTVLENRDGRAFPFRGKQVACAAPVYQFEISIAANPFLKDHVVHGKTVMPVGACWEMALAAAQARYKTRKIALKDYTQHEAMAVHEDEPYSTVQVVLASDAADVRDKNDAPFEIFRRQEAAGLPPGEWRRYVSGRIFMDADALEADAFENIRNRCDRPYEVGHFVAGLQRTGNVLAAGDNGLWRFEEILLGNNEALGKIAFSDGFMAEAGACRLHPSIFEPCLHTLFAIPLGQGDNAIKDKIFLPVGVDDVRYLSALAKEVYCHAAVREGKNWRDSGFVADFQLFTSLEEPIARITGVYMRHASAAAFFRHTGPSLCYGIQWQAKEKDYFLSAREPSEKSPDGCWFILGDNVGIAEKLARSIQADGQTGIVLHPDGALTKNGNEIPFDDTALSDVGSDEKRLEYVFKEKLPELGLRCQGVIHCCGIEPQGIQLPTEEIRTAQETERSVFRAYSTAVHLLRAVAGAGHPVAQFCLLTRGAQAVVQEKDTVDVRQAPLWGMRKCLAQEHPELNVRIFDLDPFGDENQVQTVYDVLKRSGSESEIAIRNDTFYAPRLVALPDESRPTESGPAFDADATYLLTGGLGGVGLETAQWLADNGAGCLVLTGRGEPGPPALEKIDALQKSGVRVRVEKADVTDPEALAKVVLGIRESLPPLKGAFHLAGIPGEGDLLRQSLEDAARIMAPKVQGAWNLHLATLESNLDCFVLFSSISSLWGGHGLGAYAGANAFLDALAHLRKSLGLPAIGINWGAFARVGMIAQDEKGASLREKSGLESFPPKEALNNFTRVMDLPQACIVKMNWKRFFSHAHLKGDPLFSSLAAGYMERGREIESPQEEAPGFLATLQDVSEDKRRELLGSYLGRKVAEALGMEMGEIAMDGDLLRMGMDSLIFLTLAQTVSKDLHIRVVPHKLFENPTVEALAREFAAELTSAKSSAEAPVETVFAVPPDPAGRYEPFDLTDIQHAYWLGRNGIVELGDVACHVYFEIEAENLDLERYTMAWQRAVDRHDMLRAVILPDGRQQILKNVPQFRITTLDLRNRSPRAIERETALIREEMSHQVRPADQWPLFEIRATLVGKDGKSPDDHSLTLLHISIDVLIADGFSIYTLMQEVSRHYRTPDLGLAPIACSFRDYVLAEKKFRESPTYRHSKDYWLARLESLPPSPELPLAQAPSELKTTRFKRRQARLDSNTWERLQKRASQAGLTRSNALLAAYSEVLATWSKSRRFTLNLTFFHRLQGHPQINEIVGDFTSLILLQVDAVQDAPFKERALKLQSRLWKDMEFRYFSGVRVLQELSRKNRGRSRTFMPVVFTSNLGYENIKRERAGLALPGKVVYSITQTPQVWLDNQISEDNDGLTIVWDAVEALFPPGMLDEMFEAYCRLLGKMADEKEVWDQYRLDLAPDRPCMSRSKTEPEKEVKSPDMLHSLFFSAAARTPEKGAVVSSSRSLSYGELSRYSREIGQWLKKEEIAPNTLVAVVMEKGWEQIAAVLGVLCSGAAYLPIDPSAPGKRLRHLMRDGEVRCALTQSWLENKLEWPEDVVRLSVDAMVLPDISEHVAPEFVQTPDDLAYVIHTSGSTGLPKGVMIEHRGAVNTVLDIDRRFGVGPEDKVLAISALNFDLSVYDIFGTLAAGGAIVLPDAQGKKDPGHWLNLMRQERVTVWNSVPETMRMLVEYAAGSRERIPDSLRLVLLSGDWIPLDLPEKIRAVGGHPEIVSLGGATEASIWSILYPVGKVDAQWKSIPYGRSMTRQQVYVLNENMEDCPVWTTGQLHIGGTGLARGYWRDKKKTEASFVRHPSTGIPLYRTGDLGRFLPDGNIEFLGREDQQVKINGYRIELGEIESTLKQLDGIMDAVVVPLEDSRGNKYLAGHLVPRKDRSYSESDIKEALKQSLPEYMIPSFYFECESFPVTANGKIDRKKLADPQRISFGKTNSEFAAPETETEQAISNFVKELVGIDSVGAMDLFFDIGATSMHLVQLQNRLNETFEKKVSVVDIFEYPTIRSLAEFIDRKAKESASIDRADKRGKTRMESKRRSYRTASRKPHEQTV